MDHNTEFLSTLKPYKVIITKLNLTRLIFFRKFRPKRFLKIDSRVPRKIRSATASPSDAEDDLRSAEEDLDQTAFLKLFRLRHSNGTM
jgi:hypothetical protein